MTALAVKPEETVTTQYWQLEAEPAGVGAMLRRAPVTVRSVLSIMVAAAPAATALVLVLQTASGLLSAFGLLATRDVFGDLLSAPPTSDRITAALPALAILVAVYALRGAFDATTAFAAARIGPAVRRRGEEQLIRAAVATDLIAYDDAGFYDRLHRARDRGLPQLEQAAGDLVAALGALLSLAGAIGAVGTLHPLLAVVLLLALLPEGWMVLHGAQTRYAGLVGAVGLERRVRMLSDLASDRASAAELRANQNETLLLDRYRTTADALRRTEVHIGTSVARAQTIGRATAAIGLGATFAVLILLVDLGWTPLAAAGAAVIAVRAARAALTQVIQSGNRFLEQGLYVADYFGFVAEAERNTPHSGSRPVPVAPAEITLTGVTFRYPGSSGPDALTEITLTLRRGESVALVGLNGSGKTTLAKVVAGLYRPESGTVCWDGVDVRDLERQHVLDRVSTTFQHPVRWPDDARTNIRTGRSDREDADERALRSAARKARADEVVAGLPDGWDTLLTAEFHGGRDLSAGQWQRLAVARGIYRDAPVLIWDEPTAPLDPEAEFAVYESLRAIAADRTSILITHRMASVRYADRIVLLHEGRIAETGTHDELLAAGGRYASLWHLQQRLLTGDEDRTHEMGAPR